MATPLPGELCVTHSPIKSSYWGLLSFNLRTRNQPDQTKEWNPSCLCRLSWLAWFNAYSVITLFSFSSPFVERFSGLAGDLFFMVCPSSLAVLGTWAFPAPAGKLASVTWQRLTHERNSGHRPSCYCCLSLSLRVVSQNMLVRSPKDPRIHKKKKKSRHSMWKQSYLHYLLNPTQQNVLRLWMSATKHNRTHSACNRHHHHHHQVTDIFMSHRGCCRYWETSWTLITI